MYELLAIRGLLLIHDELAHINKRPTACCGYDILPYMNYCPICSGDITQPILPINMTNGDMSLFLNPGKHRPIIGFTINKMFINDVNALELFNMYHLDSALSLKSTSISVMDAKLHSIMVSNGFRSRTSSVHVIIIEKE